MTFARMNENKVYAKIAKLFGEIQGKLSELCDATLKHKTPKEARESIPEVDNFAFLLDPYADLNREDAVILDSLETIDKALHILYVVSHAELGEVAVYNDDMTPRHSGLEWYGEPEGETI